MLVSNESTWESILENLCFSVAEKCHGSDSVSQLQSVCTIQLGLLGLCLSKGTNKSKGWQNLLHHQCGQPEDKNMVLHLSGSDVLSFVLRPMRAFFSAISSSYIKADPLPVLCLL